MAYDPSVNPDPAHWLALTEEARLNDVLEYHERVGTKLPNARVHAALHVTVENQLAQQYGPTVEALRRLLLEGLDRHEAVHAIGTVVAAQMYELLKGRAPKFDEAAYERELAVLTADRWRRDVD
jgi:hypothetical protein